MSVLALGGVGACRVVESKPDGAAVFCPVVGAKRLPGEQAAALWPYLVHLVQNGLACAVHHNAHSSWSSESQRRLGS